VFGAALIAERLGTGRELRLRELLGSSLYVAEPDAPMTVAIARGTGLPASARHTLRAKTSSSGELMLHEGASEQAVDAIGALRVEPFTGTAEVRFDVSAEGLLSVSASEVGSRRPLRAELATDLSATRPEPSIDGRSSLEK
jgi:hypothetical protein